MNHIEATQYIKATMVAFGPGEAISMTQDTWAKLHEAMNVLIEQPAQRKPLTPREIELIDGMIEVQMNHAEQCEHMANRTMAERIKGWDMERVALLQKLREKNT